MIGFFIMLKSNVKLVIRNKTLIFLLLLIPLISTLILKIPLNRDDSETAIFKMSVTVFDNSSTLLSEELINLLKSNSSFIVNVKKDVPKDLISAKEKATDLANKSIINGFIYIPSDFSDSVIKGKTDDIITIFSTGTDERVKVLENNINMILLRFNMYSRASNGDKGIFEELMKKAEQDKTASESVPVISGERALNSTEKSQVKNFGYFVAILAMTLMFSGNFISSIFIEEKENRILKRITLTKSSMLNYAMVKGLAAFIALIVQVTIIIIGIKVFVKVDVGINLTGITILILGLGLIFNSLSLALGTIFENLSSSNYLAFFIASISSLMAGLYFPLDITPEWMQNVSLIMPQRWIIKTAEQMLLGVNNAVMLFGIIVLAYMTLFLTIGFLGLKMNNK